MSLICFSQNSTIAKIKTDKFVFVKEVYDDGYYVILEKNEDILLKLINQKNS